MLSKGQGHLFKAIYKFTATLIKLPIAFFTELEKKILKFALKHKRAQIAKATLRKKIGAGGIRHSGFRQYYKNSHQLYQQYAAAAKLPQSFSTLCNPIDSPPGSPVPGFLQARTLEWVAISFSNAWKVKVKVKSFSCVQLSDPHGPQPPRLLRPWDSPDKSTGMGCYCLLPTVCHWHEKKKKKQINGTG